MTVERKALADGIERVPTPDALRAAAETLVKKAEWARSRSGMQPAERDSWRELAEQLEAVSAWLAALRTPAPAADAVEAVARAIDEDTAGVWLPYNVSRIGAARIMARAALSALPRPAVDEGAVERAGRAIDGLLDAYRQKYRRRSTDGIRSDAPLYEEMRSLIEARAALAAAQERS